MFTCQGMPLLLCITTVMMEHLGPCDWTLPDMGAAQCFLGSPRSKVWNNPGWSSFFSSPEFLYFHSILLALQAANIIFFMLTVYYLVDHWRNSAALIKSETKGNFLIVLKLFFIMGGNTCPDVFIPYLLCSGIPWFGEFVSYLVTEKIGPADSFWVRFSLDVLNLFTVSITVAPYILLSLFMPGSSCFCCSGV